ncbi:MAG: hypothetical protein WC962_03595, partial [Phycisphaerae bacterium]
IMFMTFCMMVSGFLFVASCADDANEPNNPNEELSQVTKPEDTAVVEEATKELALEQAWADANSAFESESRGWMREEGEQVNIARASLRTTQAELQLLRMIAQSEGAENTVAAIDKLLADRTAKVEQVTERAKNSRREEIMRQREERRKAYEERRKNRQTDQ